MNGTAIWKREREGETFLQRFFPRSIPLAALLIAACCVGCAGGARPIASSSGPRGSPRPSLTIAFDPETNGSSPIRLTATALQPAVVYGEAKPDGDGYRISLTRLAWFSTWANGWTQASFLLDGIAALRPSPGGWTLSIESEQQLDSIE